MVKIRLLALCFFCAFTLVAKSQNRYVVFFTDKENTPYTVEDPEAFLSQRSIERRTKQGIGINATDLPVDPAYVNALRASGPEVYFLSKWMNAALIQAEPSLLDEIEALDFVDSIALVAPDPKLTGNSRKYHVTKESRQEADETASQLGMLGLDKLHEQGLKGEGMLIAILDGGFTGADAAMPFEHIYGDNHLLYTLNLVENDDNVYQYSSHGTQVLSTIAGLIPDEYTGGAYEADFMLFITEDNPSEYRIEEYNWLVAAEKADSAGADIITTSLGYFEFDDPSMNYTYEDMDGETALVTQAANFATDRGIIVVVSAGNEGNGSWHYITSPADAFDVISVGAINSLYQISPFSSYGPSSDGRVKPEVVTLGSSVAVIDGSGTVTTNDGTSFSAPLLASLATLLWQQNPALSALDIRDMILQTASMYDNPDDRFGYGVAGYDINITGLWDYESQLLSIFPNPVIGNEIKIKTTGTSGSVHGVLYDGTGKQFKIINIKANRTEPYTSISMADINPGIYMLQLTIDGKTRGFKIVKY